MSATFKKLLPHLIVVLGFVVLSLTYFYPVLQGKMIYQNDIKQYEGMARQQKEFREDTGQETYWNNAAFGGMPTYAIGARFPNDVMDWVDRAIRFLPRPADYLFLYFINFYILMLVMRVPWKYGVLGALAFGFSTYLIIILGVGHNAKAHAVAYFPLVLSGILLVFQRKYIWGFVLTALAMGLEIQANHYQMTYYLGLLVVVLGIAYLVDAIKKKELPHFFKSVAILIVAVALGIATNATTLLSTMEYAKVSIRGENYLAEDDPTKSSTTDGLDYDYITEYSYGKLESLNLFIPKLMGVGRASDLGRDSEFYQKLIALGYPAKQAEYYAQGTPLYWGAQPFVEAPPYLGVTVVFLALLGFLLIKGRLRWWLLGGMIVSLLLSWGKNLEFVTRFFVETVPLYNKFRAVSSIQVLLELLIPIAAVFGIYKWFTGIEEKQVKLKKLAIATGSIGGLCLLFWLVGGSLFDFKAPSDTQLAIEQPEIFEAIKADRIAVMKSDALRSLLFVVAAALSLWLFFTGKIKEHIALILLGIFIVLDLGGVDRRSVDEESFITNRAYQANFEPTAIDKAIQKDNSYYRVLDLARGLNNSHINYFFNGVGGYSAVRPRKIEDVFYKYLAKGNTNVINMLNIKYILQPDKEGKVGVQQNAQTNGPAWFVKELKFVDSQKEAFEALEKLNTKQTAVVVTPQAQELEGFKPVKDSVATIAISKHDPDHLTYNAYTPNDAFAVFAETYYKNGWKAYIDGNETSIYEVNYMLRGIKIPKGKHNIEFKFEPVVVQTGSTITLFSSLALLLLLIGALFLEYKNKGRKLGDVQTT
ncbi:YfhO family protein [Aquimarina sp. ERC-38]|uniref:YfhO family protein n=1 Tax=Aquimarina sp. ERC-38 TaxID=2949996 RepID=UPI002246AD95|nr:YfhO family protein [Aquimarina sp. ERC-38]UZO79631.1 YfhO family protein [Aquimarina sp. ERC-38]